MKKVFPLKNLQKIALPSHSLRSIGTTSSKFQSAEAKVDEVSKNQRKLFVCFGNWVFSTAQNIFS